MSRCPFCGSQDLIEDAARGDTICGNPACGEVLSEQAMVASTHFMQTSNGAAVASGARISFDGVANFCAGVTVSSQEVCIQRGISKIGWISSRLQLSSPIQEAARRIYQLAVQLNFNQGRATRFIACACLYIVCRRKTSPHLLIDFSDVLQTPVKTLGRIYIKLLKRLVGGDPSHQAAMCDMVEVPMIDPSVYIERFARKLPLGDDVMQGKVQSTAMRIIQFMHRDWICIGRRPNGLCGAALLIAGFYHGFQVPAKAIAEVVRIQEGTLKLRLTEMRRTPLALMSREQFEQAPKSLADLERAALEDDNRALPPCLIRSRQRQASAAQAAILDKELQDKMALTDAGAAPTNKNGGKHLKPLPPVPPMLPLADTLASDVKCGTNAESSTPATGASGMEPPAANASKEGASAENGTSQPKASDLTISTAAKFTTLEPSEEGIEDITKDIVSTLHPSDKDPAGPLDLTAAFGHIDALVKGKPSFDLTPDKLTAANGEGSSPGTPKSLTGSASGALGGKEESLSDVDDEELEAYLLDKEEQQHKSDIWHEVNKDYLEEWHVRGQEARRKKRQAEDSASETGSRATSGSATGSRRSRRMFPPATSCTQSAIMALTKKGRVGPDRINMEALESLFQD